MQLAFGRKTKAIPAPPPPPPADAWPNGVLRRALNAVGAPIDITYRGYERKPRHPGSCSCCEAKHIALCHGCGRTENEIGHNRDGIARALLEWVDDHADECRFLARPDGG